jgi:hypothetical protein
VSRPSIVCRLAAAILVLLAPSLGNGTDWFITNPQNPSAPAPTLDASGGGPTTTYGTIILCKHNGSFYGSWGSADPIPAYTDDVLGDWVSTLSPEYGVSQFNLGQYKIDIGNATKDFTVSSS